MTMVFYSLKCTRSFFSFIECACAKHGAGKFLLRKSATGTVKKLGKFHYRSERASDEQNSCTTLVCHSFVWQSDIWEASCY